MAVTRISFSTCLGVGKLLLNLLLVAPPTTSQLPSRLAVHATRAMHGNGHT